MTTFFLVLGILTACFIVKILLQLAIFNGKIRRVRKNVNQFKMAREAVKNINGKGNA